jgi:hypothetical protein
MARSRLERVRSRRAGKQGVVYLVLAAVIAIAMFIWGLPLVARLAGLLIKSDNTPAANLELRPTPPIFSDVPEATFSATVSVAGFSQPGVDVVLYLNGSEVGRKLTSDSGTFEFSEITLQEGENEVFAYALSKREVQSEKSKSYLVTLDATKPSVTIDSPHDGDVFRGQGQRITTFSGGVNESGSRVYIGERMVIVQSDGKFSLPYQLVEGDQELQIKAVDLAGNENVMTLKLRWEP